MRVIVLHAYLFSNTSILLRVTQSFLKAAANYDVSYSAASTLFLVLNILLKGSLSYLELVISRLLAQSLISKGMKHMVLFNNTGAYNYLSIMRYG